MNKNLPISSSDGNRERKSNRLIKETSPYLLQHSYNPVEWYPWGDEAFEAAKKENKPVFLSIGYSTCHWCHVMEKESFENEQVAELLNKDFICVKVDREERPDIDAIYMQVLQRITGFGGWPMTLALTPDKKPFFAGTYFPKDDLGNRMGMMKLIPTLAQAWKENYFEIIENSNQITDNLNTYSIENNEPYKGDILSEITELQKKAAFYFVKNYDKINGGFGIKPKFPSSHNLDFLYRYGKIQKDNDVCQISENTLLNIYYGGIQDHIGGGFHRYSTDEKWIVPHFEKMLYDNVLLLSSYSKLFIETGNNFYLTAADKIYDYLIMNLMNEQGLFYSAEDADSEGVEGKFYIWEYSEVKNSLLEHFSGLNYYSKEDLKEYLEDFLAYYSIKENGNFNEESSQVVKHTDRADNIFYLSSESVQYINQKYYLDQEENSDKAEVWEDFLEEATWALKEVREQRVKPFKDKKILTDWNALTISALSEYYLACKNTEVLSVINISYHSLLYHLEAGGELKHTHNEGKASINAFLDDYAYLIQASLDYYKVFFSTDALLNAIDLSKVVVSQFYDSNLGGFFQAGKNNEILIAKNKDLYDGAIPSGNSVMLKNLIRLFKLTGNQQYFEQFYSSLKFFAKELNSAPSIFCYLLNALFDLDNDSHLIIATDKEQFQEEMDGVIDISELAVKNMKNIPVIVVYSDETQEWEDILGSSVKYEMINGQTTYFLCNNFACAQPTTNFEEVLSQI